MENALNVTLQFGQFAIVVIVVCVAVMLFVSIMDRHPRDHEPPDEK